MEKYHVSFECYFALVLIIILALEFPVVWLEIGENICNSMEMC